MGDYHEEKYVNATDRTSAPPSVFCNFPTRAGRRRMNEGDEHPMVFFARK